MSDMKILLTADLNVPESIAAINDAIATIQKKIIKLHLEVDTSGLKDAQVILNNMEKKINAQQKRMTKATHDQVSRMGDESLKALEARVKQIDSLVKAGDKSKVTTITDRKGNIKEATIEYTNASGKLIQERMAWEKFVNNVVVGYDANGKKIRETRENNVFRTQDNVKFVSDIAKNKKIVNDFIKTTTKELNNLDLGKTGLADPAKVDKIRQGFISIRTEMENLKKAGKEITDVEMERVQKSIEANKLLLETYKQEEAQTKSMSKSILSSHSLNGGFTFNAQNGNLDKTREDIAKQVSQIYGSEVKPESIAITANAVNGLGQKVIKFNAEIETGKNKLKQYSGEVLEASKTLNILGESVKNTANRNLSFTQKFSKAMESIPIWMAGMTAFYQTLHFFTDGVSYVNEFNKSLTQLSIVSGKSQKDIQSTGEQIRTLANDMSVSTQELGTTAVDFARQGLQGAAMIDRMTVATKYAKISNMETSEAGEILTATINSMGVSAEKAADVFSYMGDATATGADELGRAMQRVGGTAGALNIPLEKVSSWIAVVSSKTREGAETIGNSIKTILARVQNLKETGFDETDGTQINDVAKALSAVGIQLVDAHGEFRDFGKVMDELGAKWQGLDKRTQAYIATTVAGTYQQSRFLNLMDGYPESVNLATEALNQAGIANKKFALYQDGTEAKLTELKNAWTGIFQDTFKDKGIQQAVVALTQLVSAIGSVVHFLGSANTLIAISTLAFMGLSKAVRGVFVGIGKGFFGAFKNLVVDLKANAQGTRELNAAMRASSSTGAVMSKVITGLGRALKGLAASFVPMLALMGVVYVFQKISDSMEQAKERAKALQTQIDTVTKNWGENKDSLKSLISTYTDLYDKTDKGKVFADEDEQQKYNDTMQKLGEMLPNLIQNIDDKGQAHLKSAKAIEEETKQMDLLVEAERKRKESTADELKNSTFDTLNKKRKEFEKTQSLANTNINKSRGFLTDHLPSWLTGIDKKAMNQSLAEYKVKVILDKSTLNDSINEAKEMYKGFVDDLIKDSGEHVSDAVTEAFKGTFDSMENFTQGAADKKLAAINTLIEQIQYFGHASIQSEDQLISFLNSIREQAKRVGMSSEDIDKLIKSLRGVSVEARNSEVNMKAFAGVTDQLNKSYESTADIMGDLNSLMQDYADGKAVSAEAAASLIEKDSSLVDMFKIENGQIKLNIDAIKDKQTAELSGFDIIAKARRDDLVNANTNLNSMLTLYGIQIDMIQSVALAEKAKADISAQIAKNLTTYSSLGADYVQQVTQDAANLQTYLDQIADLTKSADIFKAAIKTAGGGKDKKDKGTKDKDIEAFDKASADYEKKLDDINQKIDESKDKLGDYASITKEYREELKKENGLLGDKQTLMGKEQTRLTGLRDKYQKQLSDMGSFSSKWSDDTKNKFNDLSGKVADYNGKISDLKNGWRDTANEIKNNNLEIDSSVIAEFDNRSQELEGTLGNIEAKMSSYPKSSKEYRTALISQVDVFKKLQKAKADEAKTVRDQMANEKVGSQQWLDNKHLLEQLSTAWWNYQASIDGVTDSLKEQHDAANEALLKPMNDRISALGVSLETLQSKMKTYPEESRDYRLATIQQIDIYKKMQEQVHAQAEALREQMETEKKGSELWNADNKLLLDLQSTWWGLEASISGVTDALNDQKKKIADEVVDAMKNAYEQQKDAVLDSLDAQIKAIDEAHDAQMKALDDQMAGYEKLVNAKKASLQADQDARKYAQDLKKAQDSRSEIQKKIDLLKLDNSAEGRKRLAELQKQLAESNMDIENMQYDHSVELQQNELDNALDAEKERIDNLKENAEYEVTIKGKTEKKKYDIAVKALNDEKEAQTKFYDSIIDNDKKWADVRTEIMNGHFDAVQTALADLETSFTSSTGNIAKYLQDNVIAKLEEAKKALSALGSASVGSSSGSSGGGLPMSELDRQKMKANADEWKTANKARQSELEAENQAIGKRNGWYYENGVWYRDSSKKEKLFHKGGIVGGSGSSATNLINKLFNKQPNEEVVKALKGELFAPHSNIVKNFMPNMRNLASSLVRPVPLAGAGGDIHVDVYVDKLIADDKKAAKRVATDIVTEVKMKGGKI